MRSLEPLLDAAVATLKSELPTRIGVVNQEYTGFVLPVPDTDAYYAGGLSTYLKFPSVEVAAPDWNLANPSLAQVTWEGTAQVMARVIWQHMDFDTLHRGMLRYSRCLAEVLSGQDCFGVGQTVTSLRGFVRFNPETGEREEFVAGALVVCQLDVVEVAP